MLLGTLSHLLYGYSTRSRKLAWEVQLNDSVLSLCSHQEGSVKQVFAGLADGTISVVENIQGAEPKPETLYILIGSNPVTCLCLVDRRLWCACGNRMVILNARTLDNVDSFQTSCSTMDYISLVKEGPDGVWVTLRGSSVLQLWDTKTLTCRLLFDIQTNCYAKWTKQEDPSIPASYSFRITSLLPLENSLLVGTAEGLLIFYDVKLRNKSPRQSSAEGQEDVTKSDQQQSLPESSADVVTELVDIPFARERNDSGCYSANTTKSLSRRTSEITPELLSTGGESDHAIQPLSEEYSEETTTLKPSSSNSGADTLVSPTETTWEEYEETLTECVGVTEEEKLCVFYADENEVVEPEICRSLDLDTRPVRHYWLGTDDYEEDSDRCVSGEWRRPSVIMEDLNTISEHPMRRFDTCLRSTSNESERYRSVSLSDIHCRGSDTRRRGQTASVDDLQNWIENDSPFLSMSVTSGSYDFDDLLIPYTDDDSCKGILELNTQDAEAVLQTFLQRRGFSETNKEKCESEVQLTRTNSCSTSISTKQNQEQEKCIKPIDSWTSFKEMGQRSSSTNGFSYDDTSATGEVEVNRFFQINRDSIPSSAFKHDTYLGSETSSNISTVSEIPYVLDLVAQEKIKISDKPIKCLLKANCGQELCVVSGAGCYGDDEAVLRWTKEGKERMWTNDPIVEVCPYTNTIRPSLFTRSRLPRRTSLESITPLPQSGHLNCNSSKNPSSAATNVNSRFAKVHSMFSRSSDKVDSHQ